MKKRIDPVAHMERIEKIIRGLNAIIFFINDEDCKSILCNGEEGKIENMIEHLDGFKSIIIKYFTEQKEYILEAIFINSLIEVSMDFEIVLTNVEKLISGVYNLALKTKKGLAPTAAIKLESKFLLLESATEGF